MKPIISERGETPDSSGELGKLLKQTEDVLKFDRATRQGDHQVLSGLASVVNGLATISNVAGDRHGLTSGNSIDDPHIATLCLNAAGTLGLALIEIHLFG